MNLLQIILSVTGFVFLLLALDLYQRKKFTIIHFLAFFSGTMLVVLFSFDHAFLDRFGNFFGVARGADLLVYISIIGLAYLYFELLNKLHARELATTELARSIAITNGEGSFQGCHEIVVIIPCYGEDMTAVKTITNVVEKGYAVVCVDDGNNSVNLSLALSSLIDRGAVVLLKHPYNMGQGAALQTGSSYVLSQIPDARYVVHFDADGQHQIADLPRYLAAFKEDPSLDIVLGSRFLGASNMSSRRRFHKKLQVFFMWMFVGLKVTDTNNGYRVITTKALPKLTITLNGMAHASELEQLIHEKKLHYKEVPVTIVYSDYSMHKGQSLGVGNSLSILGKLLRKWFFSK